jgi:hypothetical protein
MRLEPHYELVTGPPERFDVLAEQREPPRGVVAGTVRADRALPAAAVLYHTSHQTIRPTAGHTARVKAYAETASQLTRRTHRGVG